MNRTRQAVANTGLLVAAIRASESTRADRLFTDPYADKLAGDQGRALLSAALAVTGEKSTAQIVVRTRFFDDALLRAARVAKQIVILAAGMDARAYRLRWPDGTTVYELNQSPSSPRRGTSWQAIGPGVGGSEWVSTSPTIGPPR
jgi:methyltransferase (TIGR00027 family)